MKLTRKILRELIKEELIQEKTVRLSTKTDADFAPGDFVSLLGKKGRIKLDKKSVHSLAKIVRSLTGKFGMGWSFTEGKAKIVRLPNGVQVKIEFKGLTLKSKLGKVVFLDRTEMQKFFKATSKYLREMNEDFGASYKQLPTFSSKEAKKVVDDGLRLWAKDLRKVEYRVIKDWMSKAKSGVIDYFDLVRGLETGDIARAHPYETKFFKGLLDRDKIVDRFRKYFGGKKGMRGRR